MIKEKKICVAGGQKKFQWFLQNMSGKTAGWDGCTRDTLVTWQSSQQPLWNLPWNISAWSLGFGGCSTGIAAAVQQNCCSVLSPAAPGARCLGEEWGELAGRALKGQGCPILVFSEAARPLAPIIQQTGRKQALTSSAAFPGDHSPGSAPLCCDGIWGSLG